MVFPESPRVIYTNNTLHEVVCELRFPPILKIESEPPANFQESIRGEFPLYKEKRTGPELPAALPREIARMVSIEIQGMGSAGYEFTSADQIWTIGLTKQSLSLSTSGYVRWEDFKQRMSAPLDAVRAQYSPPFYQRVGLKYQNIVLRSALGISLDVPWSSLLKAQVIGEIADQCIGGRIKTAMHQTGIQLDDDGFVQLNHYLAQVKVEKDGKAEQGYVIDADFFFRKRTEVNHVWDRLDRLNKESGRLFRWCITEELHNAMGPTVVESADR